MEQFDNVSGQYGDFVAADPFRRYLHYPAVLNELGNRPGRRLLDVGCGDGLFTEMLSATLSSSATGYDSAPGQVAAAEQRAAKSKSGNTYIVGTPESFNAREEFDDAVSVMVLSYASHPAHLASFFESTAKALRKSGRFVSVVFNPEFNHFGKRIGARIFKRFGKSGVEVHFLRENLSEPAFTSRLCQFSRESYEGAARPYFNMVRWRSLSPSPEGVSAMGSQFWQECERHPPYVLFVASEPDSSS